jgi:hypothetical protein
MPDVRRASSRSGSRPGRQRACSVANRCSHPCSVAKGWSFRGSPALFDHATRMLAGHAASTPSEPVGGLPHSCSVAKGCSRPCSVAKGWSFREIPALFDHATRMLTTDDTGCARHPTDFDAFRPSVPPARTPLLLLGRKRLFARLLGRKRLEFSRKSSPFRPRNADAGRPRGIHALRARGRTPPPLLGRKRLLVHLLGRKRLLGALARSQKAGVFEKVQPFSTTQGGCHPPRRRVSARSAPSNHGRRAR